MKFKTTAKAVKEKYADVIKIGYCDLQHLLSCESASAYTCGVYGWNADIYTFNGVAICTGHRPFGNISPDHDIVRKYDDIARKITLDHERPWAQRREQLAELIKAFIGEVANNA